jgi:hypothetical protein
MLFRNLLILRMIRQHFRIGELPPQALIASFNLFQTIQHKILPATTGSEIKFSMGKGHSKAKAAGAAKEERRWEKAAASDLFYFDSMFASRKRTQLANSTKRPAPCTLFPAFYVPLPPVRRAE